jgi:hypothetical protein
VLRADQAAFASVARPALTSRLGSGLGATHCRPCRPKLKGQPIKLSYCQTGGCTHQPFRAPGVFERDHARVLTTKSSLVPITSIVLYRLRDELETVKALRGGCVHRIRDCEVAIDAGDVGGNRSPLSKRRDPRPMPIMCWPSRATRRQCTRKLRVSWRQPCWSSKGPGLREPSSPQRPQL